MKQPAINPESMTNPNTAAIMVSPKSREVMTATLMMMIFFILLLPSLMSCIFLERESLDCLAPGNCKGNAIALALDFSRGDIEK